MPTFTTFQFTLVLLGTAIMTIVMLRAIGQSAMIAASDQISERRQTLADRREADAAAEAAGRAASIEPLALNADGSLEEPIVATVENAP